MTYAASSLRANRIRCILNARFSLGELEASMLNDPLGWSSARNHTGRSLYAEAMNEWRRLETLADDELNARLGDAGRRE